MWLRYLCHCVLFLLWIYCYEFIFCHRKIDQKWILHLKLCFWGSSCYNFKVYREHFCSSDTDRHAAYLKNVLISYVALHSFNKSSGFLLTLLAKSQAHLLPLPKKDCFSWYRDKLELRRFLDLHIWILIRDSKEGSTSKYQCILLCIFQVK